jgi:hypothetical protein
MSGWFRNAENSQASDGRGAVREPTGREQQHSTWTDERLKLLLELNERCLAANEIRRGFRRHGQPSDAGRCPAQALERA